MCIRDRCDGVNSWVEPNYTAITGYADLDDCDGLDNDCDGDADDEGTAPDADLQQGVCAGSLRVCGGTSGWVEPDYTAITDYETVESRCDALDNDCNGQADDLSDAPLADLQDGVCAGAKKTCDGVGGFEEPDYAAYNAAYADLDDCDGLDNDCDGEADDEGTAPDADLQQGVCAGSLRVCGGLSGWVEPDYTAITGYADLDDCDGLDNDCDGDADDEGTAPAADLQQGVCAGSLRVCAGTSGWVLSLIHI